MRRRLLTNLRIDEVSSVDRGAGKGVRVMLLKRHGDETREWDGRGPPLGNRGYRFVKGESDMPNTLSERVAKSHSAALRGEITFAEAASDQMDRAVEMFPHAKSPGEAMQKYMQTAIGKADVNNLHRAQHIKQQWDTRVGDAVAPGAILKGKSPKTHLDDGSGGAVEDEPASAEGLEEPWDKRVKNLMDKHGWSQDQAISHLHRAEKVSKGF
jgi:hypothetical protein